MLIRFFSHFNTGNPPPPPPALRDLVHGCWRLNKDCKIASTSYQNINAAHYRDEHWP